MRYAISQFEIPPDSIHYKIQEADRSRYIDSMKKDAAANLGIEIAKTIPFKDATMLNRKIMILEVLAVDYEKYAALRHNVWAAYHASVDENLKAAIKNFFIGMDKL